MAQLLELDEIRRIYHEGFAAHLRVPLAELLSAENGQQTLVLTAAQRPQGFAVIRPLADTGWTWLRYFVVDTRSRSRGLGTQLWQALTARLTEQGSTMLLFDVEDPEEQGCSAEEKEIRLRRIAFYERNNALLLPVNGYVTPHGENWGPMKLMAAPLVPDLPWTTEQAVLAVYQHHWNLPATHPTVQQTLTTTQ